MNKKGQMVGFGIVLGIVILIIGFATLNLIKPEIDRARDTDGLNCASADTISDGNKIACLITGSTMPYIIWSILSLFGGMTIMKLLK